MFKRLMLALTALWAGLAQAAWVTYDTTTDTLAFDNTTLENGIVKSVEEGSDLGLIAFVAMFAIGLIVLIVRRLRRG